MQRGRMCRPRPRAGCGRRWGISGCEARIERVRQVIAADPAGDLPLDGLADVAVPVRFRVHRVLQGMPGETAAETVRRRRLHRAKVQIATTRPPMARIAAARVHPTVQSLARARQTEPRRVCPWLKRPSRLGHHGQHNEQVPLEVRERAVRLALDTEGRHPSRRQTSVSVAAKIGCRRG